MKKYIRVYDTLSCSRINICDLNLNVPEHDGHREQTSSLDSDPVIAQVLGVHSSSTLLDAFL